MGRVRREVNKIRPLHPTKEGNNMNATFTNKASELYHNNVLM